MKKAAWSSGTDLRKAGVYVWPPHMVEAKRRRRYVSVTRVLDDMVAGSLIHVHNWYVAKGAVDLFAAFQRGDPVYKWSGQKEEAWVAEQIAASDLLNDPHYMKNEGFRQMRIAAARGTLVHDVYGLIGFQQPEFHRRDILDYAKGQIVDKHLACTIDQAKPYIQSFVNWWDKFRPVVKVGESAVFSNRYRYAGTFDGIWEMDEEDSIWDIKTSKDAKPSHAMQLAAYKFSDVMAVRGTLERIPMPHAPGNLKNLLVGENGCVVKQWRNPEKWFAAFTHLLPPWFLLAQRDKAERLVMAKVDVPISIEPHTSWEESDGDEPELST